MKTHLSICLIFISIYFAHGQGIKFEKNFNYHNGSFGEAILQLPDDGFLVGGYIIDTLTASTTNMFLMQTDRFGDTIWAKHYEIGNLPLNWGTVKKIYRQPNGDIILFGLVNSCVVMMKTDSVGNVKWIKNYERYPMNFIGDIFFTSDNSFVLGVESDSSWFPTISKMIVMKIDTSGTILWKNFFSKDSVLIKGVTEINNSYYALFQNNSLLSSGLEIVKISLNGNYLSSFKWTFNNYPWQPALIKTDNFYLTVACSFSNAIDGNLLLFKSDTLGNIFWNKTYTKAGFNYNPAPKIIATSDSGFTILFKELGCIGASNISLVKTNNLGDTLWTKAYGLWDETLPGEIIQSADNGYAIAGYYGGAHQLYLIKTDINGNSGCNYYCPGIIVDTTIISLINTTYAAYNDTIFSSSLSGTTYTGINETVICFSTGITEKENDKNAFNFYPNPANKILHIVLNKKESITILNLLGEVLQRKDLAKGITDLDISFLSSGIYFIKAGNEVRKFVKE